MDGSEEDQSWPHRLEPHQPVSLEQLKELGVFYWQVSRRPLTCAGFRVKGQRFLGGSLCRPLIPSWTRTAQSSRV